MDGCIHANERDTVLLVRMDLMERGVATVELMNVQVC